MWLCCRKWQLYRAACAHHGLICLVVNSPAGGMRRNAINMSVCHGLICNTTPRTVACVIQASAIYHIYTSKTTAPFLQNVFWFPGMRCIQGIRHSFTSNINLQRIVLTYSGTSHSTWHNRSFQSQPRQVFPAINRTGTDNQTRSNAPKTQNIQTCQN